MDTENIMLAVSITMLIIDILINRIKVLKNNLLLRTPLYLGFFLYMLYYATYLGAFLRSDFSLEQVSSYSSSSLSPISKLFASWAGSSGSLLLLGALIGIVTVWYIIKTGFVDFVSANSMRIFFIFFAATILFKNPFNRLQSIPTEGYGLNPQLQTPWMISHPPIVFTAYALLIITFALILGEMSGEKINNDLIRFTSRASWILFTVGIATGGVWAYQVLGWGGYWSWDPVETASLLPWLGLTAYLHLSKGSTRGDLLRELTILAAFDGVIFLSALTRGGLLNSVHAYAFSPAGPVLLMFALIFTIYFFLLAKGRHFVLLKTDYKVDSVSTSLGLLALAAIFVVCLMGVAFPILFNFFTGSNVETAIDVYNLLIYPFILLFTLSIIGCSIEKFSIKSYMLVVASLLVLGAVMMTFRIPTGDYLADFGFPTLVVGFFSTLYSFGTSIKKTSWPLIGRRIVHLGIVVALIGVFISSTSQGYASFNMTTSNSRSVNEDISITIKNVTASLSPNQVFYKSLNEELPEYSEVNVELQITYHGRIYQETILARLYANSGYVAHPLILSGEYGDLYLYLDPSGSISTTLVQQYSTKLLPESDITVFGKEVPLIWVLWAGIALMVLGSLISITIRYPRKPTTLAAHNSGLRVH